MANSNTRVQEELDIIANRHFLTVSQLAQEMAVSEMTVRRDLRFLAEENKVKLVYGGVISVGYRTQNDYTLSKELEKNIELKLAIVKRAVQMLGPQDVIFLDSGTTAQLFAEQIPRENINTIICSSLNSITVLIKLPFCTVITPGGVYSPKPVVFYDTDSPKQLRKYRAAKCFIGATGFDLTLGLTCGYVEDVPLKQAMIESSKEKILLLDSSKFGQVSTCLFAKIEDFTTVITDAGIPDEYAERIRSRGIDLIIV